MKLDKEMETYERNLPSLLEQDEGKFVVIRGDEVLGVYETYADAVTIGYDKYGLDGFLVQQVSASEEVLHFSRDFGDSYRT